LFWSRTCRWQAADAAAVGGDAVAAVGGAASRPDVLLVAAVFYGRYASAVYGCPLLSSPELLQEGGGGRGGGRGRAAFTDIKTGVTPVAVLRPDLDSPTAIGELLAVAAAVVGADRRGEDADLSMAGPPRPCLPSRSPATSWCRPYRLASAASTVAVLISRFCF